MIKYFDILQHKSNIRGYWKDKGKLYIDNIQIRQSKDLTRRIKFYLFNYKKQLAIFYLKEGKAFILDNKGNKTILKTNIKIKVKHIKTSFFKELLRKYNGFTVYKNKASFTFDIWQA